jgi:hypothetical protein
MYDPTSTTWVSAGSKSANAGFESLQCPRNTCVAALRRLIIFFECPPSPAAGTPLQTCRRQAGRRKPRLLGPDHHRKAQSQYFVRSRFVTRHLDEGASSTRQKRFPDKQLIQGSLLLKETLRHSLDKTSPDGPVGWLPLPGRYHSLSIEESRWLGMKTCLAIFFSMADLTDPATKTIYVCSKAVATIPGPRSDLLYGVSQRHHVASATNYRSKLSNRKNGIRGFNRPRQHVTVCARTKTSVVDVVCCQCAKAFTCLEMEQVRRCPSICFDRLC